MELAAAPETRVIVIGGSWLGMTTRGDYVEVGDAAANVLDFSDASTLASILGGLEHRLAALTAQEKQIYVVLNPPGGRLAAPERQEQARIDDSGLLAVKSISMEEHLARTGPINARIRALAERAGAVIIDPEGWICTDMWCHFTDTQGIPHFKDMTHFRARFVRTHITDFDALLLPSGTTDAPRQPDSWPLSQIRQAMPQQHS